MDNSSPEKNVLLLAVTEELQRSASELLGPLHERTITCENLQQAQRAVDGFPPPQLLVLEVSPDCTEYLKLCSRVTARAEDYPAHIILIGENEQHDLLIDALEEFAHDIITTPCPAALLQKKIHIGLKIVTDKCTMQEISQVMERYSQHIDEVAAERTRQLIHAERLSTLGVMSAEIAHEINTPIAYVSSSLEAAQLHWNNMEQLLSNFLSKSSGVTTEARTAIARIPTALGRIEHGIDKINRLTSGLKKFGRASREVRVRESLNNCIEEALEIINVSLHNRVLIEKRFDTNLPDTLVDPQQIEQVLLNTVINASHALEDVDNAIIRISTFSDGETVNVSIEDNGPGIAPDILETIWKPFYTTKEVSKGTGLGLAISRSIITSHGGSISALNGPLGGACFTISLPIVTEK